MPKFEQDFEESIRSRNRFFLPSNLHQEIIGVINFYIDHAAISLAKDTKLFRARIHEPSQEQSYSLSEVGAPPPHKASAGRVSPEGIPCLYLAGNTQTAVAEVRPWVGAKVTVAEFIVSKELNIVSLEKTDIKSQRHRDKKERIRHIFAHISANQTIGKLFASPAHSSDKLSYLTTQWISEYIKSRGFDGIRYESVLYEGGSNTAIFNPENAKPLRTTVTEISSVQYTEKS